MLLAERRFGVARGRGQNLRVDCSRSRAKSGFACVCHANASSRPHRHRGCRPRRSSTAHARYVAPRSDDQVFFGNQGHRNPACARQGEGAPQSSSSGRENRDFRSQHYYLRMSSSESVVAPSVVAPIMLPQIQLLRQLAPVTVFLSVRNRLKRGLKRYRSFEKTKVSFTLVRSP
jgi:hypothetical protein